jgi:hypothetical protein
MVPGLQRLARANQPVVPGLRGNLRVPWGWSQFKERWEEILQEAALHPEPMEPDIPPPDSFKHLPTVGSGTMDLDFIFWPMVPSVLLKWSKDSRQQFVLNLLCVCNAKRHGYDDWVVASGAPQLYSHA